MWSGQRRQKGLSNELAVRLDVGRWASQVSGSVRAETQDGKPVLWDQLECGFGARVRRRRGRGMRGGDRGSRREAMGRALGWVSPMLASTGIPKHQLLQAGAGLSRSSPRTWDRGPQ